MSHASNSSIFHSVLPLLVAQGNFALCLCIEGKHCLIFLFLWLCSPWTKKLISLVIKCCWLRDCFVILNKLKSLNFTINWRLWTPRLTPTAFPEVALRALFFNWLSKYSKVDCCCISLSICIAKTESSNVTWYRYVSYLQWIVYNVLPSFL